MTLDEQTRRDRALAALDEMADTWAVGVALDDMVAAISSKDDAESRMIALAKQAFIEGAYRAYCDATEQGSVALAAILAKARRAGMIESAKISEYWDGEGNATAEAIHAEAKK